MALKNNILNDFFSADKVPTKVIPIQQPKIQEKGNYSKFRVFDDAIEGIEEKGTNRTQIEIDTGYNKDTNGAHTGNINISKMGDVLEIEHTKNTQQDTIQHTNRTQITPNNSKKFMFPVLSGHQKILLLFLYDACKRSVEYCTDPLTLEEISHFTNIPKGSVKTSIARLIKKNFLTRLPGAIGRGGWTNYQIPAQVFKELLLLESEGRLHRSGFQQVKKQGTQTYTEQDTNHTSSSSLLNINTTTTSELPDTWTKIDLSSIQAVLNSMSFKKQQFFGNAEIKKIYSLAGSKLTANQIQESIYHFAYGLKNHALDEPYSTMSSPGAILFNKLSNGDIWFEPKYITKEEESIKNVIENLCDSFEKDIKKYFSEWATSNYEENMNRYKNKVQSTYNINKHEYENFAWDDFIKNIWSGKRKALLLQYIGEDHNLLIDKVINVKYRERKK